MPEQPYVRLGLDPDAESLRGAFAFRGCLFATDIESLGVIAQAFDSATDLQLRLVVDPNELLSLDPDFWVKAQQDESQLVVFNLNGYRFAPSPELEALVVAMVADNGLEVAQSAAGKLKQLRQLDSFFDQLVVTTSTVSAERWLELVELISSAEEHGQMPVGWLRLVRHFAAGYGLP